MIFPPENLSLASHVKTSGIQRLPLPSNRTPWFYVDIPPFLPLLQIGCFPWTNSPLLPCFWNTLNSFFPLPTEILFFRQLTQSQSYLPAHSHGKGYFLNRYKVFVWFLIYVFFILPGIREEETVHSFSFFIYVFIFYWCSICQHIE